MNISEIRIKNFGKLHNINIHPISGINVVYGENEAGKSTLQHFITGMLFGLEKQEGEGELERQDVYRHYEPWDQAPHYGGALRFAMSGKFFLLERNFRQEAQSVKLINEKEKRELNTRQGALEKLLGSIRKETYENTYCIGQASVETKEEFAEILQDFFVNAPLDEDFVAAYHHLEEGKQAAESQYQELREKRRAEEERILAEKARLENDVKLLKSQQEEAYQTFRNQQEGARKIGGNEMAEYLQESRQKKQKIGYYIKMALSLLLALLGIAAIYWNGSRHDLANAPWGAWMALEVFLVLVVIAGIFGVFFWQGKYERQKKLFRSQEKAEDALFDHESQGQDAPSPGSASGGSQSQDAREGWQGQDVPKGSQEQESYVSRVQKKAVEGVFQVQMFDKQSMLMNLQEELEECRIPSEEEQEADCQIKAYQLAQRTLEDVARDIHQDARQRLEQEMSQIFGELTHGKYTKVGLDEQMRLVAWEGERKVYPWQLSRGTMEQMYVALRMGAGRIFAKEGAVPILMDEVFAAFDDRRLEAAMQWLGRQKGQIFLFTCQKREMDALERSKIPYGKIVLG